MSTKSKFATTIKISVDGRYAGDETSRAAMRKFCDQVVAAGGCDWRNRLGTRNEWEIWFVNIADADQFKRVLIDASTALGLSESALSWKLVPKPD